MIFKKLVLNNFKSYKNEVIDFYEGITIIVGENGAGKTTIFDAINFALFKKSPKNIKTLIRNTASSMSVELEFISNSILYKVVRKSSGKPNFYVDVGYGFELRSTGDKKVNEEIKNILRMDYKLFSNSIYIKQGEIAELINKKPADRKKLIGNLLGIDTLENAWSNMQPLIKEYEMEYAQFKVKLDELDNIEIELEESKQRLIDLDKDKIKFETKLDEINNGLDSLKEKEKKLRAQKETKEVEKTNLKNKNSNLDKLIQNKNNLLSQLDEIICAEEEMKLINDNLYKLEDYKKFKDNFNIINSLIEDKNKIMDIINFIETAKHSFDNKSDIDSLENLNVAINQLTAELSSKIEDTNNKINLNNSEIASFKQSIKSNEKPLKELELVEDKCPICKSDISEDKKLELINDYVKQNESNELLIINKENENTQFNEYLINDQSRLENIKNLSNNVLIYQNDLNQIKKNFENLNINQSDNLNEMNLEIDKFIGNFSTILEKYPELSFTMDKSLLDDEILKLEESNERFNQLKGKITNKEKITKELENIDEEIIQLKNTILDIENTISSLDYNEDDYDKAVLGIQKLDEFKNDCSKKLGNISGIYETTQENISKYVKKLDDAKIFKKNSENLKEHIDLLNEFRALFSKDGIQRELRDKSTPVIEKNTKFFFEKFNFNYSDLYLDENYEITLMGPEGESDISMISGGEKIAVAIALRLGITKSIANDEIKTILLDEPTIHLDTSRKQELVKLLMELSILPQMIIVTHETQLESAADNLIKVEKENGISKIIN